MDLGVTDRVFVVTGGSRGLGRATAEVLVAEGARVVLGARDPQTLADVVTALGGPDRAMGLPMDLTDPSAPERLMAAAVGRYGRVDGALISCGGPPPGDALTTTDEEWRAGFEGAFLGPLRVARAVTQTVGEEGAAMSFVLSSSVRAPLTGMATSNGLRPGLASIVQQLAEELAPHRIRVNGLLPGRIDTDRVRELDARSGRSDTSRRRHEAMIALGRYGDPVEFGTVAAFTLSPAASYMTGSLVAVDGGSTRAR
ncbi:MAG: SDR family oxidoreductase [Actinomycetes bacterium]